MHRNEVDLHAQFIMSYDLTKNNFKNLNDYLRPETEVDSSVSSKLALRKKLVKPPQYDQKKTTYECEKVVGSTTEGGLLNYTKKEKKTVI
jgi:hypothetical protein